MTSKVTTLLRAPGVVDPGRVDDAETEHRDPEVPERAKRRTFTANYTLEILAAYDAAPEGAKGALLRREGLYSSHIVEWRKARDAGALAGLAVRRGRKRRDPQAEKIARLEAEKRPPNRWHSCSPISVSHSHIHGRTSLTTTRSARRSSRR